MTFAVAFPPSKEATLGSLLPFAAFANKINVKSEGERRLCGTKPPLNWPQSMTAFCSGGQTDTVFSDVEGHDLDKMLGYHPNSGIVNAKHTIQMMLKIFIHDQI